MKLVLVFNPMSGRGEGLRLAKMLEIELGEQGDGHEVELFEVGPGQKTRDLTRALQGYPESGESSARGVPADGLIVIGGDGTVHSCAEHAARTDTPLYHFPTGTENLFSREFGMDRNVATVRAAIENLMHHELAGRPMPRVDLGRCNGRSFLLMASVGIDANIVHRLCRNRTGRISHLSYLPHILAELVRPCNRPLTITVDGVKLVEEQKGLVVVANSRQYALRVDPARGASMADGKFDVVFFPANHWSGTGLWMLRSRFGGHIGHRRLIYRTGEHVRIESHGGEMVYQLDGEAPAALSGDPEADRPAVTPMELTIEPGVVPIMVPERVATPGAAGVVQPTGASPTLA
ncbi:MAG: diacylglycerol/lipid kinase family protein [Phycisphaerales bacterium]